MHKGNLKKLNLAKLLSIKTGFSLNLSKKLTNDLVYALQRCNKNGNLNLKNLRSFKIIKKKQRIGRNPKTKEEFIISSRKSVSFTASRKITKNLDKLI